MAFTHHVVLRGFLALLAAYNLVACGAEGSQPGASERVVEGATGPKSRIALVPTQQDAASQKSGLWAFSGHIPVAWPSNLGLLAGEGELSYTAKIWLDGASEPQVELCELSLPGYTTRSIVGGESYLLAYPAESYSDGQAQSAVAVESAPSASFAAKLTFSLGLQSDAVSHMLWPKTQSELAIAATTRADSTLLGAPIDAVVGDGLMVPAVNRQRTRRAKRFFTALMHRLEADFVQKDSDHMAGELRVSRNDGVYELHSATLGCTIAGHEGADEADASCSKLELTLANTMAPKIAPTGSGVACLERIAPGTACATLRPRRP